MNPTIDKSTFVGISERAHAIYPSCALGWIDPNVLPRDDGFDYPICADFTPKDPFPDKDEGRH